MDNTRIQLLQKKFERRWRSLVKNSERHDVDLPKKELLWNKLLERFQNGFRCAYCDCILMVEDSRASHPQVFSIDHKISLYSGGNNSIYNLEIVCHRCNIIKGTMRHETFMELVYVCPPDLLDRMLKEIWAGRLADKLQREDTIK